MDYNNFDSSEFGFFSAKLNALYGETTQFWFDRFNNRYDVYFNPDGSVSLNVNGKDYGAAIRAGKGTVDLLDSTSTSIKSVHPFNLMERIDHPYRYTIASILNSIVAVMWPEVCLNAVKNYNSNNMSPLIYGVLYGNKVISGKEYIAANRMKVKVIKGNSKSINVSQELGEEKGNIIIMEGPVNGYSVSNFGSLTISPCSKESMLVVLHEFCGSECDPALAVGIGYLWR